MKLIQECFELRQKRLALQREVDAMEQKEKDMLYDIQKQMTTAGHDDWAYNGYHVHVEPKTAPSAKDWPTILNFIRTTGQLDLLQKRLTESAVKARWDSGVDVPGIDKIVKYSVTITKETT